VHFTNCDLAETESMTTVLQLKFNKLLIMPKSNYDSLPQTIFKLLTIEEIHELAKKIDTLSEKSLETHEFQLCMIASKTFSLLICSLILTYNRDLSGQPY